MRNADNPYRKIDKAFKTLRKRGEITPHKKAEGRQIAYLPQPDMLCVHLRLACWNANDQNGTLYVDGLGGHNSAIARIEQVRKWANGVLVDIAFYDRRLKCVGVHRNLSPDHIECFLKSAQRNH